MPSLYTLTDWPEDRLPNCSVCSVTVPNGAKYGVPSGSILFVCAACMEQPDAKPEQAPVPKPTPVAPKAKAPKREAPVKPKARPVAQERVRADRTCLWCSGPLPNGPGNRAPRTTYCSRAHFFLAYSQRRQAARTNRTITCPVCSKNFIPASHGKRGRQQYCSLACYTTVSAVYQRRKNAERRGEIWAGETECPVCGLLFLPKYRPSKDYVQKTCSRECSRQVARRLPWKTCPGCQGEYQPRRSEQIFCTAQCRRDFAAGRAPGGPAIIPWAEKYDGCVICGTTDRRHAGNGECTRCYVPKSERSGRKREPRPLQLVRVSGI